MLCELEHSIEVQAYKFLSVGCIHHTIYPSAIDIQLRIQNTEDVSVKYVRWLITLNEKCYVNDIAINL